MKKYISLLTKLQGVLAVVVPLGKMGNKIVVSDIIVTIAGFHLLGENL